MIPGNSWGLEVVPPSFFMYLDARRRKKNIKLINFYNSNKNIKRDFVKIYYSQLFYKILTQSQMKIKGVRDTR
jgi:predicted solute-binding protein